MGTRFHGAYACSDACFRTRRTDTAINLDYTRAQGIGGSCGTDGVTTPVKAARR